MRALLVALALATPSAGCVATGEAMSDRPRSYTAMRVEGVVPQRQDFTCGAASLATIMTFYWGRDTGENELLEALRLRYTVEQIRKKGETGLSFDDLVFMTEHIGFHAQGAKVPVEELPKLNGPVVVHMRKGEYQHFVVLRRTGDGVMYLADPYVGNMTMSLATFADEYTGNALAVWRDGVGLPQGRDADAAARRALRLQQPE